MRTIKYDPDGGPGSPQCDTSVPDAEDWREAHDRYQPDSSVEWALVIGEVLSLSDPGEMEFEDDFADVAEDEMEWSMMRAGILEGAARMWWHVADSGYPRGELEPRTLVLRWRRLPEVTGEQRFRRTRDAYWRCSERNLRRLDTCPCGCDLRDHRTGKTARMPHPLTLDALVLAREALRGTKSLEAPARHSIDEALSAIFGVPRDELDAPVADALTEALNEAMEGDGGQP